jgi:hypothetical protein
MQIIIISLTLYFEVLVLGFLKKKVCKFTWIREKGRKIYKLIHINTKYPQGYIGFYMNACP